MANVNTLTTDRREIYRRFMGRFNPTVSPKKAIDEGLICQAPELQFYKKLAARADINPGCQQVLVGGIGSGKTTQLLLAQQSLNLHPNTHALYIDVTAETDLSKINYGALLASFGVRLSSKIVSEFKKEELPHQEFEHACDEILKSAYGYEEKVTTVTDFMPEYLRGTGLLGARESLEQFEDSNKRLGLQTTTVRHEGKLNAPFPALHRDTTILTKNLRILVDFTTTRSWELVAVFDGLDRLIRTEKFWEMIEQDFLAMRQLGISVLAAGPLSILYGQNRQIADYFDEVHYMRPVVTDPRHSSFLMDVMQVRGAKELLSEAQMKRLTLASGGVLRDLITLARNAGENAYLDDADQAEDKHVNRAIEQLGNGYLLGLGTKQVEIIRGILDGKGFSPSDPDSMELLVTRRVLEQSVSRYEVHPALAMVLQSTADVP